MDFCPSWSPDGRYILYTTIDVDQKRYLQVIDLQGNLIMRTGEGFNRITEPSWSPDGQKIVYIAKTDESYDIYIQEITISSSY